MQIDIPDKLVKKLRVAYSRAYGKEGRAMSDRAVVIALLTDSLHPISASHLT